MIINTITYFSKQAQHYICLNFNTFAFYYLQILLSLKPNMLYNLHIKQQYAINGLYQNR